MRNARRTVKMIRKQQGFSLIELVIVVVIIAIIGAIAIPRLSRGSAGAADSALIGNLRILRSAIDLYASEHGGTFPDATNIGTQLTSYSDDQGNTVATKDTTHIYGPYLRAVPSVPVGGKKGQNGIAASTGATVGWLYDSTNGTIKANCTTEADAKGTQYQSY